MATHTLRHVDDSKPGITRRGRGARWSHIDAAGDRSTDRGAIDRLNAMALPPANRDARFRPHASGDLQAIGIDDKGRTQYRGHLDLRARQDAAKYERCAVSGRALPKLRARVDVDPAGRKPARDTMPAAIARLLDPGTIRVGDEAHATRPGARRRLVYCSRSGKVQRPTIEDRRLAGIVRRTQDLPGRHLFEYPDGEGVPHPVGLDEVNDPIRQATGGDFIAEHFRTLGASRPAFGHARATRLAPEQVASALGRTAATAGKSYVPPVSIEMHRTGDAMFLRPPIAFVDEVAVPARAA